MLTAEEERRLALAWRDRRDPRALDRLVGSHLRFVLKIARGYRGYGLPLADLVAEGNVGLMQAAEKFDPEKGFRFATYAMWWIKAAIQEYVLRSASLVKMGTTAAQKKLFFNLKRMKARRDALEAGDMSPEDVKSIAHELGVPEQDVVEMNRRLAAVDASLDAPVGEDGDTDRLSMMADETPSQEARLAQRDELAKRRRLMGAAMERLDPRERRIIEARRLKDEPSTLEELSHEFNVSRERVRQLEVRAFEKLRKAMLAANDAPALPAAA
ncbi:MAG: RNA polymerase sigma factor RpoH [Rhodospirillales bacterium]|nr:RNA polymerase sigma factor RpoH [Rhodospirillales bacterium]